MIQNLVRIFLFLLTVLLLISPTAGVEVGGGQATVTLVIEGQPEDVISKVVITASDDVKKAGYTINGQKNCQTMEIPGDVMNKIIIRFNYVPDWASPNISLTFNGQTDLLVGNPFIIDISPHSKETLFEIHLWFGGEKPDDVPTVNPAPDNPSVTPDIPSTPDTPDVPDIPDTPENPDTPGSDDPGSDEPLIPILPPAGWVKNFAGFIPLLAGFLLLFLLFFMRGNLVYRILVKNAKKHGEKPDKEEKKHLKEIAGVIVGLVKVEDKYPEWRKNSDVMKRLWFDIESVLDEMNYARAVPRGAVVAEILKAARGRINRHRL